MQVYNYYVQRGLDCCNNTDNCSVFSLLSWQSTNSHTSIWWHTAHQHHEGECNASYERASYVKTIFTPSTLKDPRPVLYKSAYSHTWNQNTLSATWADAMFQGKIPVYLLTDQHQNTKQGLFFSSFTNQCMSPQVVSFHHSSWSPEWKVTCESQI